MKIQILSDLHNEFLRNSKPVENHNWKGFIPETDADIVILAGDIDTGAQGIEWACKESNRLDKPVIYVLGNHEFYHHEYGSLKNKILQFCGGTNVHCLDCGLYVMDGVRFIGATLWTDYEANVRIPQDLAMYHVGKSLADHYVIKIKSDNAYRKFKPIDALAIHRVERRWIEEQLAKPFDGKTVVVTHHGPHHVCQHPQYPVSDITSAFHSDLSKLIDENDIDLWIYGHTHTNLNIAISKTRIISNQAGYPGEHVAGFDASLLVEI